MTVDLVVARHNEDTGWLRNIPRGIRSFVYNKGTARERTSEIPLPNHGREAQSYLFHIVSHYHELPETTIFCQGRPFDHAFDFHDSLARLAREGLADPPGFEWLGHIIDTDDATGSRLYQRWSKNAERTPLDMADTWSAVFDRPCPETFTFACGAQFAVTRSTIHRRPHDFYLRAEAASRARNDAAHAFERMWDAVFDVPGFPEGLLAGRTTIYRKPIRRLQMDGSP
ncbi:MAG: DUF3431 domain-containing protein [Candidatus Methylacidiphilales bacterium]|nr:DUF3431 domain-containing protein [Candidatus Methylacidiphilales bacterium]